MAVRVFHELQGATEFRIEVDVCRLGLYTHAAFPLLLAPFFLGRNMASSGLFGTPAISRITWV